MLVPKSLFVTDPVDRLMHHAGVPRNLWYRTLSQVTFSPTEIWGAKFDAVAQRQAVLDYVSSERERHKNPRLPQRYFFAVVSSPTTGDGALAMCAAVLRAVISSQFRIKANRGVVRKTIKQNRLSFMYIDAATWVRPKYKGDKDPDIVVIWNLNDNSTADKIENARQLVSYYSSSVRLLAVAGVAHPEKWCLTQLRLRPHIAFKVKDVDPDDFSKERKH